MTKETARSIFWLSLGITTGIVGMLAYLATQGVVAEYYEIPAVVVLIPVITMVVLFFYDRSMRAGLEEEFHLRKLSAGTQGRWEDQKTVWQGMYYRAQSVKRARDTMKVFDSSPLPRKRDASAESARFNKRLNLHKGLVGAEQSFQVGRDVARYQGFDVLEDPEDYLVVRTVITLPFAPVSR